MIDGPQRHRARGEGNDTRRMRMDHPFDVGARLVDLAVDETLKEARPPAVIDGIAIRVVLVVSAGASERDISKLVGLVGWRMLTWPKPSSTP